MNLNQLFYLEEYTSAIDKDVSELPRERKTSAMRDRHFDGFKVLWLNLHIFIIPSASYTSILIFFRRLSCALELQKIGTFSALASWLLPTGSFAFSLHYRVFKKISVIVIHERNVSVFPQGVALCSKAPSVKI